MMLVKLKHYAYLMRLHKPIGILLLLWPTLWALFLAAHVQNVINLHVFVVFIAGVILMRSAGCVINDVADRKFDGRVSRTQHRPLVTGSVSTTEALCLFVILCAAAFALVLTLNLLTILLAIPGILLATSYPFMKRVTHLPQLVLGLAFSWGIPMAYAATLGFVPTTGWLVMLANIAWTIAYDTEYAMVDREDDLKVGIKSTAIFFGRYDRLIIALLQVTALVLLFTVGSLLKITVYYYIGIFIAGLLIIKQQTLIVNREPQLCFRAFLNNNWFGFAITLGILVSYTSYPSLP